MTTIAATVELDTQRDVLAAAREQKRVAEVAQTRLLELALTWAEQHPQESIHEASCFGDTPIVIAGQGAPLVAEFAVAEFAAAVGLTTDSGKRLIGEALELAHRLPRLWARVVAGTTASWRARRVAERTTGLSPEAAAFVDEQVAGFAHRIRPAQIERLVDEAIARHMPATAKEIAAKAADARHFTIERDQLSFTGTMRVEGELDLADAYDLDDAVATGAEQLRVCGSTDSLDIRRAVAVGELARRQLALGFEGPDGDPVGSTRERVLHLHLAGDALDANPSDNVFHLGRLQTDGPRLVTVDQIRGWLNQPGAKVTVRPVIDLADQISVNAYEIPDRLAEQVRARDHTCVFPWCQRPARSCDLDHVIPYQRGCPTSNENLAPLCRRHHRLKTHSTWRYTVLDSGAPGQGEGTGGAYLWSSPHGLQFLRDHTGTTDVTRTDWADRQTGRSHPPDQ